VNLKLSHDCHHFAYDLWKGVLEYFQIPFSQLSYFKLNEEGEYESIPASLTHVFETDSYWECAFGINVYEGKDVFRRNDNTWYVI
jgi:hypothetical protein